MARMLWVFIIILINTGVFLLEPITSTERGNVYCVLESSCRQFSFIPERAFDAPWTFVTSMFLHADFSHLFFNMFALFIFGMYLEPLVGSKRFLMIYFLTGIMGNFGYMLTATSAAIPGIGASGAVYGVIGTMALLRPFALVFAGGFVPMPMIIVAIFYAITEFMGLFVPSNIARGAHLGGLFLGVGLGLLFRKELKEEKPKKHEYL